MIDGDTVVVRLTNGREEKIRVVGIDTPETVDPRKPVQCFGPEASRRMHVLLDGRAIELQSKPDEDRDKYGRLLRYISSGGKDIGAELIVEGYARSYIYFPHPRLSLYNALQREAKAAKRGLWGACAHPFAS